MLENHIHLKASDNNSPVTLTPDSIGIGPEIHELLAWLNRNITAIQKDLSSLGAILFRGFNIITRDDFREIAEKVDEKQMTYVDGNSPRSKLKSNTYTSTEFPADQFITLHSELSYSNLWPLRMMFCCIESATKGGATPISDNAVLLEKLPKEIVEEFEAKGLCYIRNLHSGYGLGPSWQKTFETDVKSEVEDFCKRTDSHYMWLEEDSVRIKQYRPAIRTHPISGQRLWFNQADQFHISNFNADLQAAYEALYEGDSMSRPQHVTYGDHSEIDPSYFTEIRKLIDEIMLPVSWISGDLVYIDNMRMMHGREPFEGDRTVLLTMFK